MSVVKNILLTKIQVSKKTKQNRLMISLYCAACGKKNQLLLKKKQLSNDEFKMNKIINKFLLTGAKFMPELHLKEPRLTYSACGPFIKHPERIQKFRQTGNLKNLHRNELDKVCFAQRCRIL